MNGGFGSAVKLLELKGIFEIEDPIKELEAPLRGDVVAVKFGEELLVETSATVLTLVGSYKTRLLARESTKVELSKADVVIVLEAPEIEIEYAVVSTPVLVRLLDVASAKDASANFRLEVRLSVEADASASTAEVLEATRSVPLDMVGVINVARLFVKADEPETKEPRLDVLVEELMVVRLVEATGEFAITAVVLLWKLLGGTALTEDDNGLSAMVDTDVANEDLIGDIDGDSLILDATKDKIIVVLLLGMKVLSSVAVVDPETRELMLVKPLGLGLLELLGMELSEVADEPLLAVAVGLLLTRPSRVVVLVNNEEAPLEENAKPLVKAEDSLPDIEDNVPTLFGAIAEDSPLLTPDELAVGRVDINAAGVESDEVTEGIKVEAVIVFAIMDCDPLRRLVEVAERELLAVMVLRVFEGILAATLERLEAPMLVVEACNELPKRDTLIDSEILAVTEDWSGVEIETSIEVDDSTRDGLSSVLLIDNKKLLVLV